MLKKEQIRILSLSGILTAMVFLLTAYLHIPANNGYVHVGDGLIYLAACLLPRPYAMGVGACGALLADCLTGFLAWAPGSAVIKALSAMLFSNKGRKALTLRNILALLPAAVVNVGGYYLYEALLYGDFIVPLAAIPSSLVQSAASTAVFLGLALAVDKVKNRIKQ